MPEPVKGRTHSGVLDAGPPERGEVAVHDHIAPRSGIPVQTECCMRVCCDGPTWHLWPFCTIREALRRWRTRTAGTDSFLASPSRRLTTPAHPDLDPQVSPPARVQSPDGAT